MKRLTIIFLALGALFLGGCSSAMKNLGEAGAFEPATCYDREGRQWTGTAACQELARSDGEARTEEAKASLVASIKTPGTDDPRAWDKYYEAVEDGPLKASINGGGGGQSAPVQDSQAQLARTALMTDSQERVAWIGAGSNLALGGLNTVANIVQSKFAYKERKAMWAAFEQPSVSVDGMEGDGSVVNVGGATGIDGSRVMANQDGFQSGAHDDAGAIAARNVTDPTLVTGACDEGDSQCDEANAPFITQTNPTTVEAGLLGGR